MLENRYVMHSLYKELMKLLKDKKIGSNTFQTELCTSSQTDQCSLLWGISLHHNECSYYREACFSYLPSTAARAVFYGHYLEDRNMYGMWVCSD